jgi:pyruvyltransferase
MRMKTALRSAHVVPRELLKRVSIITSSIRGALLGNGVTAYWYTGEVNFGDLLTPVLLRYYGFTPVLCDGFGQAQVLSAGSLLQNTPEHYAGHIVGSGLIYDISRSFRKARIWAVRGELTRERIHASKDTVLGDPGLLSSKLLREREGRQFALGIVPHYVDQKDPRVLMIKKRYAKDVLIINVQRNPSAVIKDIDRCACILSSSLHGLVVADSLNIPNAWIHLSDKVIGKGFKYRDYFSAMGISYNPVYLDGRESLSQFLKYSHKPHEAIEEIKEMLDSTFRSLRNEFESK